MRFIKVLRDTGKNVILIAHIEENKDEDRIVKRPKIETKISDDIVNMVDVVGYMTVVQEEGETKRIIIVTREKYREITGQLGRVIEPDFSKIVKACQGTETFAWSKPAAKPKAPEAPQQPLFLPTSSASRFSRPGPAPRKAAANVNAAVEKLKI